MEIKNARISSTQITMADHGVLTFYITVEVCGWGAGYGGYVIGHGYLGAKEFSVENGLGLEAMMRIMDVVGVDTWEDLPGKIVRIECGKISEPIKRIGNVMEDKWFDIDEFFKSHQKG